MAGEHRPSETLVCKHGLPYWHPCSECGAEGLRAVVASPERIHWHVEGKNAEGELLYSATVATESGEISGAPAAIATACDRLSQNGYDARIVITWVATLYCPGARRL